MLLYNAIGRHIPGIITAMESDNNSAARRIATCDRISAFNHIHITKMFEITVTTANDESTAIYHTGNLLASMVAISYAQTPPTAEIGHIVVTQYCKEKIISIFTDNHACIYNRLKQVTVMTCFFSKPDSEGPWIE